MPYSTQENSACSADVAMSFDLPLNVHMRNSGLSVGAITHYDSALCPECSGMDNPVICMSIAETHDVTPVANSGNASTLQNRPRQCFSSAIEQLLD